MDSLTEDNKTEKKPCPVFGDLGATWVPWASPEHLSMQHSRLRGLAHQRHIQPAEKEPVLSSHPVPDNSEAPESE